jgi:hypothetical protein
LLAKKRREANQVSTDRGQELALGSVSGDVSTVSSLNRRRLNQVSQWGTCQRFRAGISPQYKANQTEPCQKRRINTAYEGMRQDEIERDAQASSHLVSRWDGSWAGAGRGVSGPCTLQRQRSQKGQSTGGVRALSDRSERVYV